MPRPLYNPYKSLARNGEFELLDDEIETYGEFHRFGKPNISDFGL